MTRRPLFDVYLHTFRVIGLSLCLFWFSQAARVHSRIEGPYKPTGIVSVYPHGNPFDYVALRGQVNFMSNPADLFSNPTYEPPAGMQSIYKGNYEPGMFTDFPELRNGRQFQGPYQQDMDYGVVPREYGSGYWPVGIPAGEASFLELESSASSSVEVRPPPGYAYNTPAWQKMRLQSLTRAAAEAREHMLFGMKAKLLAKARQRHRARMDPPDDSEHPQFSNEENTMQVPHPVLPLGGFISPFAPDSINFAGDIAEQMTVGEAMRYYRDNTPLQRPLLFMPPDSHADVGLNVNALAATTLYKPQPPESSEESE